MYDRDLGQSSLIVKIMKKLGLTSSWLIASASNNCAFQYDLEAGTLLGMYVPMLGPLFCPLHLHLNWSRPFPPVLAVVVCGWKMMVRL